MFATCNLFYTSQGSALDTGQAILRRFPWVSSVLPGNHCHIPELG
jgi:hypothetical protein